MHQIETDCKFNQDPESVKVELENAVTFFSSSGLLPPNLLDDFYRRSPSHNDYFIFTECLRELTKEESTEDIVLGLGYLVPLFIPSYKPSLTACPQLEDGYTAIANEILGVMARTNFSAYEIWVLCVIFLKTYGWHKKADRISFTQFERATELHRRHIQRTLQRLEERKIIVASRGYGRIVKYGFQKDYTRWRGVAYKGYDVGKSRLSGQFSKKEGKRSYPVEATDRSLQRLTQKHLTKEKIYVEDSIESRLAALLLGEILRNKPDFKRPNLQTWAKDISLMVRRDARTPDRIREVIVWAQGDSFWRKNILSTGSLRKSFDRLEMAMGTKNGKSW